MVETLREGDKLTLPKGWKVEFRDGRMTITNKNYTAESRIGFAFYEFFRAAK